MFFRFCLDDNLCVIFFLHEFFYMEICYFVDNLCFTGTRALVLT